MSEVRERALTAGRRAFGDDWSPDHIAAAPGRLELLGNHVDYNGGPVLAAAIDRTVQALVQGKAIKSAAIGVVFTDAPDAGAHLLDAATLADWRNDAPPPAPLDYVRGAMAALLERPETGLKSGIRLAVAGDVPIGLGLSSSAALCVGLTLGLAEHAPDPTATVLIAQEAEHRAGTPCGTMDQSASVAGGVILFDSATMSVRRLTPELGNYTFAVADSGVERSLGASSYPVRVRESREVVEIARRLVRPDLPHLAALQPEELNVLEQRDDDEVPPHLLRRARHVVMETHRVYEGLAAMEAGEWQRFGDLMTTSGRSSAEDYEISHPRVEELVAEALTVDGVLGARMMGGGEGGSVLILLEKSAVDGLKAQLRSAYFARHGMAEQPNTIHAFGVASGATIERI